MSISAIGTPSVMRQVFLSHSSKDRAEAADLRSQILDDGSAGNVFLSSEHEAGPLGGTEWRSWIHNAMVNCDIVLFLASRHALSPWCCAELGMARLLDKPILPIAIDATAERNPLVGDIQVDPLDLVRPQLAKRITALIGQPLSQSHLALPEVPYPGLEPLPESHASSFFGRLEDISRISRDFNHSSVPRIVMLSGPSGCGKSSSSGKRIGSSAPDGSAMRCAISRQAQHLATG